MEIITSNQAKESSRFIIPDNADRETRVYSIINNLIIDNLKAINNGGRIKKLIPGLSPDDRLWSTNFHIETVINLGATEGWISIRRG